MMRSTQLDGRDRNAPLLDYDHRTRPLAVQAAVLDPA